MARRILVVCDVCEATLEVGAQNVDEAVITADAENWRAADGPDGPLDYCETCADVLGLR